MPAFYFDGTDDNKWLVVDGLQRLSALRNFAVDKTLVLQELEFQKHLEGKTFDKLDRSLQRKIEETQIVAYVIKSGTPPEVQFNLFRRINTGGLTLNPQEVRHALNTGIPAKTIADMADFPEFKQATENKINNDQRMLDRELVTRFVAFYVNKPEEYAPDLDTFLNKSMAKISLLPAEDIESMKENFKEAMRYANLIFGNWAFRRVDHYPKKRAPFNRALFDTWSVGLAKLTIEQREKLLRKK